MHLFRERVPAARAIVFLLLVFAAAAAAVRADDSGHDVHGTVTAGDGTPIGRAHVTMVSDAASLAADSDARGRFKFKDVPEGTYVLNVTARGYAPIGGRTVDVAGHDTHLTLVMAAATNGSLIVIGQVRSACCEEALSTTAGPNVTRAAQQAAAAGVTSVGQMLWGLPALTAALPLGGGSNARVSYAVRGPDPTETLVDVDGHQVNNGGTGDFDLSLVDPAALQDVQVVYGISPAALIGPNTLGGAINVVTLQPSTTPAGLIRAFGGSFDSFGETLQSTGTSGALGYAFSLHKATSNGEVDRTVVPAATAAPVTVGSAFAGSSILAKLRTAIFGDGFAQLTFRDQTVNKDLSALLTSAPFESVFAGTWLAAHNAGYSLDLQLPEGLRFSHETSLSSQSVTGPGANTNPPFLYNGRDQIDDDWIEYDRRIGNGDLSLKADLSQESLTTTFVSGGSSDDATVSPGATAFAAPAPAPTPLQLGQTQRSVVARYSGDANDAVHYAVAGYLSDFSSFGWSFDPRAGVTWTPTASTAVRASAGTTFQSPLLTELVVPSPLPPPVNGLVSVGNPHLQPDRATEYDLGWEQLFGKPGRQTHLTIDLYRNNLRTPIALFVPANYDPNCTKNCPLSYPINAGDGVYTGAVVTLRHQFAADLVVDATWDVGSSYVTQTYPGSTILANEQTLGEPLHKASLGVSSAAASRWAYAVRASYEGRYNELNRAPFATLDASLAYRWNGFEAGLYGTNLTNTYDDLFSVAGGGVPYGGAGGASTPTTAYVLQGRKIVFSVSRRF